ncbi:MAG: cyclic nucleotide-binding domain-containing protein [Gammaproteobacteria bacterium]|nr:cyclic nucleotide-binding domain-containing protein [Gammaproteobacteria bacterium]
MDANSIWFDDKELTAFSSIANVQGFPQGETIFSEGDDADVMYLVVSGKVFIGIDKSGSCTAIAELSKGQIFGEMALLNQDIRNATARAIDDVELLSIGPDELKQIIETNAVLAEKLQCIIQQRNYELLLKEQLVATTGVENDNLHVSIKGDPSLRETAFTRERYESIADSVLPNLVPCLRKLLFETSAYRVFVGLNNGEVRINSVINPFIEEMHLAKKIVSSAYIERHFPPMDYDTKVGLIKEVTEYIESTKSFSRLPKKWNQVLDKIQDEWTPVPKEELESVLDQLVDLRKIPNFYLRNLSISVAQDAIRMQFNCDGTHIVSTREYSRFLEQNIMM